MRFSLFSACILSWTLTSPSYASLTEIHSLSEISLKNKKPGAVIFLDVDDNLLSERHVLHKCHRYLAHPNKGYRLLESDLSQIVHNMRNAVDDNPDNVIVLGLTKRPLIHPSGKTDNADQLLEQEGIPLSRGAFSQFDGTSLCDNPAAGYRNGVIYTANQEKSLYAHAFFTLAKLFPTSMSFSDDYKPNAEDMLAYGQLKGIPTEVYHFTRVALLQRFVSGDKRHPRIIQNFDPDSYLQHNKDILKDFDSNDLEKRFSFAQQHYLDYGRKAKLFVNYPDHFSPQAYLDHNPDVLIHAQKYGLNPLQFAWTHYRDSGHTEERFIGYPSHFTPQDYLAHNPDVLNYAQKNSIDPLNFAKTHYSTVGYKENRFLGYPNQFSPQGYLDFNPDVLAYALAQGIDPFVFAKKHYKHNGRNEDRRIGYPEYFTPEGYLEHNKDVLLYANAKGLDPLEFAKEHFRTSGRKQNRYF